MKVQLEAPGEAQKAFAALAAQERASQKTLRRVSKLRQKAFNEIDRLIAFIDASDPYVSTGLEEEWEDEGAQCEGEGEECEDEGADIENDGEPSLGSTGASGDQSWWGKSDTDDTEDEHDGAEPDHDGEHSLGWPANFSQNSLEHGLGGDREEQCEDEGAADSGLGDHDGLLEQVQAHNKPMVHVV